MTALLFPTSPNDGDLYPESPGESGKLQWKYDATAGVWNIVPGAVQIGSQDAYNEYVFPATDGTLGSQLTTGGNGSLTWEAPPIPALQHLQLDDPFDGIQVAFILHEKGTTTPFTPIPPGNIVVYVGSVLQSPGDSYSISGSTITFSEPPPSGAGFFAFSVIDQTP